MTLQVWLLFAVTETASCFRPGPAVLLVVSQGLARGRIASFWSSLGILGANTMYFAISGTGLGALLLASYRLFEVVKWLGAVYVIWIGIQTFFSAGSDFAAKASLEGKLVWYKSLLRGFVLQAANPGVVVFFVALLPQFIDPHHRIAMQVAILGITSVLIEFFVLSGYGAVAGRFSQFATHPRFATITNRLSGSMLVLAGARLASVHNQR